MMSCFLGGWGVFLDLGGLKASVLGHSIIFEFIEYISAAQRSKNCRTRRSGAQFIVNIGLTYSFIPILVLLCSLFGFFFLRGDGVTQHFLHICFKLKAQQLRGIIPQLAFFFFFVCMHIKSALWSFNCIYL